MMNRIFTLLMLCGISCGVFCQSGEEMTSVLLESGSDAITLCLALTGGMCVWGGLLKVAEASGVTDLLARLLAPIVCLIFRGIDRHGKALPLITMNFAANALGLGNAATPLGLAAIRALKEENGDSDTASDHMILFTVINTASLTLFPSTVLTLRSEYGSMHPLSILPAVWLCSTIVLVFLIILTRTLCAVRSVR